MPATTLASRPNSSSTSSAKRQLPPLPNDLLLLAESQWLFKEADLQHSPSILAGLTPQQDRENRAKGVNFILQVGIMLKLPQITLASASVFLHRFFMRHPMIEDKVNHRPGHHYYSVAATCLFLATKVEENCRKMKEIVVACVRVAQKNPNKIVDEQDKEFWRWRDTILQLEDILLDALCFNLSLDPPYRYLLGYLVYFGEENNKPLRNAAWSFVNDSCLTPMCLLWPSRVVTAAALYVAARHCKVAIADDGEGRAWWEVVDVDLQDLQKACNFMASVYENAPLKGNPEEKSMYQRTPEGDESSTRRARSEVESNQNQGRRSSDISVSASDVSKKRSREEDEGEIREEIEANRESEHAESYGNEMKRQKVKDANETLAADHTNGSIITNSRPASSGSEEGEVEDE